jgi:hypothetical protein
VAAILFPFERPVSAGAVLPRAGIVWSFQLASDRAAANSTTLPAAKAGRRLSRLRFGISGDVLADNYHITLLQVAGHYLGRRAIA